MGSARFEEVRGHPRLTATEGRSTRMSNTAAGVHARICPPGSLDSCPEEKIAVAETVHPQSACCSEIQAFSPLRPNQHTVYTKREKALCLTARWTWYEEHLVGISP